MDVLRCWWWCWKTLFCSLSAFKVRMLAFLLLGALPLLLDRWRVCWGSTSPLLSRDRELPVLAVEVGTIWVSCIIAPLFRAAAWQLSPLYPHPSRTALYTVQQIRELRGEQVWKLRAGKSLWTICVHLSCVDFIVKTRTTRFIIRSNRNFRSKTQNCF